LAGIPVGQGYEAELGRLAQDPDTGAREFVFADGTGQCERIVADFSAPHLAHVLAAADSTPRGSPGEPEVEQTNAEPTSNDAVEAGGDASAPVDGFTAARQAALARVGLALDQAPVAAAGGRWQLTGDLPTGADK
jgi:hypothetical protein